MKHLAIVMPVFNEEDGIQEFITEIDKEFSGISHYICIVNDCSTDDTGLKLTELTKKIDSIMVETNRSNMGHGPSTVRALKIGMELKAKIIMSVDGDGQFLAREMLDFFNQFEVGSAVYAEGIRMDRQDPWFRKVISILTRIIVLLKSLKFSKDANTPCRIYNHTTLTLFMEKIPERAITPNLTMSITSRKMKTRILEYPLTNIPRRGVTNVGSSWGTKSTFLPSRRLVTFCKNALIEQFYVRRK